MDSPMEMVALGRPFSLGMLYDCRSDSLVTGMTLWDKEKLDRDKSVIPKPNTDFKIVASESLSDKSSSLGVDASLKASFLGGLVKVDGSAKYLNDNKRSTKQARVTLQYKTTTVFQTLTMNQLAEDNLKHCKVFDKGLATHVVTGILYGAQAFFVFDQETSDDESVQDIQGKLQVMIKKIPKICIEGSGDLKMEDKDREKVKKFSCTFYGDFLLEKSPTTFEESVKIYQDLPKLLGPNGENAVPVTVYLLPLSALDSRASKLVRQISLRLVTEAQSILENLSELEMWCNDVLCSPAGQNCSQFSQKIKTFNGLCSEFKLGVQGTLAQKLPLIRGGGEDESGLAEVLKKVTESPFSSARLNQWIKDKVKEADTIKTLMKLMKNTEMVSSENALTDRVSDSDMALVFVFPSMDSTEPFLSELERYLERPQSDTSDAQETRRWYSSKDVIESIKRKAKLFGDFADANKNRDNIQFLAACLEDENHVGSTIYLYEDGDRVSENFELPSKPGAVAVGKVTHSTLSLSFSAPSEGAQGITGYRVEFCEKGQEEWKQRPQDKAGEVTVTDLSPNTEYSVRVRAVTAVGVGPAAKTSIRTSPCRPPKEFKGTTSSKEPLKAGFRQSCTMMTLSRGKDQLLNYVRDYKPQGASHVRVLLYGPVGAGKSSFINSAGSVITGRTLIVAETSCCNETCSFTVQYKTHRFKTRGGQKQKIPIIINDIMGLEAGESQGVSPEDIKLAMKGHVKDGYQFNPACALSDRSEYYNPHPTIDDKVHVVVCVLNANALCVNRSVSQKIKEIGEVARDLGIPHLAVVTHIDEICEEIEKDVTKVLSSKILERTMEMFSQTLGIPMVNFFPVRNDYEGEQKDAVDTLLLTALKHMVDYGDDFIQNNTD